MSVKGIIMFLGMNNTRLERKILIILDFENRFLPTYLPLCHVNMEHMKNANVYFVQRIVSFSILSEKFHEAGICWKGKLAHCIDIKRFYQIFWRANKS